MMKRKKGEEDEEKQGIYTGEIFIISRNGRRNESQQGTREPVSTPWSRAEMMDADAENATSAEVARL